MLLSRIVALIIILFHHAMLYTLSLYYTLGRGPESALGRFDTYLARGPEGVLGRFERYQGRGPEGVLRWLDTYLGTGPDKGSSIKFHHFVQRT